MWAGWLVQRKIEGAPGNSIRWRRKGAIDRSRNLPGSPQQQRPRDSLDSIGSNSCTMLCQQYIYVMTDYLKVVKNPSDQGRNTLYDHMNMFVKNRYQIV